jgi:hypothetical protein
MARKLIADQHVPGLGRNGHEVLAETDETGDFEILKIEDLKVDPKYQRNLNTDLVAKIARDWDMAAAGMIAVSRRRNGETYIVNGQHRAAGATLAGETEICCQVFNGLTPLQEADLRLKFNTTRPDTAMDKFRGEIAARYPRALAIRELADTFGTQINLRSDPKRGINAIGTCEKLYDRDKGLTLTRVFEFIHEAFGAVEGPFSTAPMLQAVAWMITFHDDDGISYPRMADRIRSEGISGIERKARAHRAAMGGTLWQNYYRAFIEIYNYRLPEAARLEWVSSTARIKK